MDNRIIRIDLIKGYDRSLAQLIGCDTCRGFVTTDLVNSNTVVNYSGVQVFDEIAGDVLGRRVQLFIKRWELIKIAVVEIRYYLVSGALKIAKIDEQPDIVQLLTPGKDLDLVIMAVQVFTFSLIPAQLMCGREIAFDHYFKK